MTVPGLAVTEADGVLTIRFERPESFNALTGEMTIGTSRLLEEASARDDVRVVVLTGTGPEEFVLAVNNYRQSGGGGFPHVATAPVVYNRQVEIRQLLIDWVTAHGTIDPAQFASSDWKLTSNGTPITVTS